LYVLFLTEMWERFSFYCMAAVFMLYMTWEDNGHPFLQDNASLINGLYLGTVYFTPFFGGMLADQKLGYRWAVILGGLVLGLGQMLLAIDHLAFFFGGLLAMVIGNGLFKPNISTLVGKLYPPNDARLDSAYTIFYMGINLGAFLSPLVAAYVRNRYGFHAAFGVAGVGMGVSLVVFLSCRRWLVFTDYRRPQDQPVGEEVPPTVQRERHLALLIVFVIVALFWMAFKQNANTFTLWARDSTDRRPLEWLPVPDFLLDANGWLSTELFSSINPFFVIAFSPLLVWSWQRLRARGLEPTTPAKVGLGMVLASLAFVVLVVAALAGGDTKGERMSPGYLLGAYAIITVAELCLSPMGLSLVSKLASPRQRSGWMGGWFAATAVGGYLSGLVGQLWRIWPHSRFFGFLACTSLGAALILLVFYRRLRAAMPPEKKPALPVLPEGALDRPGAKPSVDGDGITERERIRDHS
jgi:POT family proton-dependent oligopeptide transporter